MLLAGMNSVTAVNRTLQGMHEGKQLDYATPAASCWLELHVSLEGLSSIVKLASTLLSSTWLLSCLEPIQNGLTTLCSLRGSGLWPPTFLRNRTANGSWSYIKVDPFLQQVVSDFYSKWYLTVLRQCCSILAAQAGHSLAPIAQYRTQSSRNVWLDDLYKSSCHVV